jgi:hypothetical protein
MVAGTLSEPAQIEVVDDHNHLLLHQLELVVGNLTIGWTSSPLEGAADEHARKTKRSMVTGTLSEPAPTERLSTTIVISWYQAEYSRRKSFGAPPLPRTRLL